MTDTIDGILVPVVSTFDRESGELAPVPFRANIRAHLDAGVSGVVVAGSNGEGALLDERERQQLVEWARPLIPDDRWLVAGVTAEATRLCTRRVREMAERGADAVLVAPPHYYGPAMTSEALADHFRRVADESPVPLVLYNIPQYTHLTLDAGLVHALSIHGNIVGIKDSSGDLRLLGAHLASQSGRFSVLVGNGGLLYAALEMGARGGILAVGLFAAEVTVALCAAFARGETRLAGAAQERLAPLTKRIVGGLGVAGVKAAMDMVGLHGGDVRPPLLPLRTREREEVRALLHSAKLAHAA